MIHLALPKSIRKLSFLPAWVQGRDLHGRKVVYLLYALLPPYCAAVEAESLETPPSSVPLGLARALDGAVCVVTIGPGSAPCMATASGSECVDASVTADVTSRIRLSADTVNDDGNGTAAICNGVTSRVADDEDISDQKAVDVGCGLGLDCRDGGVVGGTDDIVGDWILLFEVICLE